jgi:hypothetical protein
MVSEGQPISKKQKKAIFFPLCTLLLLFQNNPSEAKALEVKIQKLKSIQIDQLDSTGCYKWLDEVKGEEKMTSAKPPLYKAKLATKSPCKEIHHFEIYTAIPKSVYVKKSSRDSNSGKYCLKVFEDKKRFSVISNPEILPLSIKNNAGQQKYWCAITSLTYKDSSNTSYLHYESIFFPEFKANTRS